jgi:hypothetical protein
MSIEYHCPYRQANLLQQALSSDKMRIAFLLGAGCPVSIQVSDGSGTKPLIPDIANLTRMVHERLSVSSINKEGYGQVVRRLESGGKANSTIEDILSHIRSLQEVVLSSTIDGLNNAMLSELDTDICKLITEIVKVDLPQTTTPYHQLANWIQGISRIHPIEIFTPNYDLLMEEALEVNRVPYFDGFVGSTHAFFDLPSIETDELPTRWARLWKLHGSVNWWRCKRLDGNYEIVRGSEVKGDSYQMIFPSHLKYDESRRLPYLAMLDRLRSFLAHGQTVLVTSGYSFRDQHLNEVIINGLRSNPTSVCFGLLFGCRSSYPEALSKARRQPNLSLLASDGAIVGSVERDWRGDEQPAHPMHGLSVCKANSSDASSPSTNCKFLLGDFKNFGNFLAEQLACTREEQDTTNE